jgi:uncharacterized protein YkwD
MSAHLLPPRRPRRVLARALSLGLTSLLSAAVLAWTPTIVAGWNQSSAESTLWQLLNGDRINNGVRPIQQYSTLINLARWRSKDMIVNDYFSHNIPSCGGCMVFHYYDVYGVPYSWGGENIGWNSGWSDTDSPVQINISFMNSSGHRANILEPKFTHGGVGAYGADNIVWQGKLRSPRMYTELFMQIKSTAPAPTPRPTPKPTPKPAPKPTPASKPTPKSAAATPAPTPSPTPNLLIGPDASPSPIPTPAAESREPFAPASSASFDLTGYRVDAPPPVEKGFFETIISSLLGFTLG